MPTTMDEKAARATINRTIDELDNKYPYDSVEELFERFSKLMKTDPSLRAAFLLSGFPRVCDEVFGELASPTCGGAHN